MTADILPLFCDIDDFCKSFEPEFAKHLIADGSARRFKKSSLIALSRASTLAMFANISGGPSLGS